MSSLERVKPAILTFTDNALNRIRKILEDAPEGTLGVRFGVKSGGCSGMAYEVTYALEENENDEKIIEEKTDEVPEVEGDQSEDDDSPEEEEKTPVKKRKF